MHASRFIRSFLMIVAGLVCAGSAGAVVVVPTTTTQILVLSNRADLISGGDALVEIVWPAGASVSAAKIALNGVSVKSAFALRANGRYMGLVTGLVAGPNVLTARVPGSGAQITITNHPIGGPVFAGAQLQPWICATVVATPNTVVTGNLGSTPPTALATTKASGAFLTSNPTDAQCNTPPTYKYYYQPAALQGTSCTFTITGTNPCFVAYPTLTDPTTRPANSAIANFTNDRGTTVKSLIRVENGSINRTIYSLVTFYDPLDANVPWAPPAGWNGKLLWEMGPSATVSRFEQTPAVSVFDNNSLSRGYMVATSSLTDHGTNSNDTLAAETVSMVKERIIEQYGQIRFTMGSGCSGGSIMQQTISGAYPGLLNGIQPTCSFQDSQTVFIEIWDCGALQANYYSTPNGLALSMTQKLAINGHKVSVGTNGLPNGTAPNIGLGFCQTWITSFLPAINPALASNCGSGFPASLVYTTGSGNPNGIRCDLADHDVALLGTFVDADGRTKANTAIDNVGLQYGLNVLQNGVITSEQFVQLQEGVGGYNADLVWNPARTNVALSGLLNYYKGGLVSDGRQLAKVAIIDLRGNENPAGDIHSNWRPWGLRARLDTQYGSHANHVIYAYNSATGSTTNETALILKAFTDMDHWLTNIESDPSGNPIEVKIVNNIPPGVRDLCTLGNGVAQADVNAAVALTDPSCPVKHESSPRQVAGGPLAENIFKCSLKPLNFSDPDYTAYGVTFTSNQMNRLNVVFPGGVCDWTQPGVGQVAENPWNTFVGGPGGVPLGAPPASAIIP